MGRLTVRIEQWSTKLCPYRPFLAPELHDHHHLEGVIDGKIRVTSRIIKTEGRIVTTKSGSAYELGEPDAGFASWCAQRGEPIDPEQPVKLLTQPKEA